MSEPVSDPLPAPRFEAGAFTPAPGRGRLSRMLFAQATTETKLALRHGEQVLLTLLIPIALEIGLSLLDIVPMPAPRVDSVTPRMFALAIMSSAFSGQAIALGFDRRYGVLKRLAATALPRWLLVAGRMASAVAIVIVQLVVLGVVAALLGWSPHPAGVGWAVLLVVLGTLAFGALGVLLGGSVRAEITLAVANLVWFVLLMGGGIVVPVDSLPGGLSDVVMLLPSGALAEGLHTSLVSGAAPGATPLLVLAVWAVVAGGVASRTTRLT